MQVGIARNRKTGGVEAGRAPKRGGSGKLVETSGRLRDFCKIEARQLLKDLMEEIVGKVEKSGVVVAHRGMEKYRRG